MLGKPAQSRAAPRAVPVAPAAAEMASAGSNEGVQGASAEPAHSPTPADVTAGAASEASAAPDQPPAGASNPSPIAQATENGASEPAPAAAGRPGLREGAPFDADRPAEQGSSSGAGPPAAASAQSQVCSPCSRQPVSGGRSNNQMHTDMSTSRGHAHSPRKHSWGDGCTGPAAGQGEGQRQSALAAPLWRPAGKSALGSATVSFTGPPTAALPGLPLPDTAHLPGAPWQLASQIFPVGGGNVSHSERHNAWTRSGMLRHCSSIVLQAVYPPL